MNYWQRFLGVVHLGEYLGLAGIALSLIGFTFTVGAAMRAKRAADAAREAAEVATNEIRKVDLIAEFATVLQLVEELKRLQRSKAVDVLPDRYSGLRAKVVAMRESKFLGAEQDQVLVQDVVLRLAALEKALDRNMDALNDSRHLARSNESLSICTDALLALNERIKIKAVGASNGTS